MKSRALRERIAWSCWSKIWMADRGLAAKIFLNSELTWQKRIWAFSVFARSLRASTNGMIPLEPTKFKSLRLKMILLARLGKSLRQASRKTSVNSISIRPLRLIITTSSIFSSCAFINYPLDWSLFPDHRITQKCLFLGYRSSIHKAMDLR